MRTWWRRTCAVIVRLSGRGGVRRRRRSRAIIERVSVISVSFKEPEQKIKNDTIR
ncbi:hypothetical protein HanRHA438_Chr15g0691801 [Helianthus annuus]|nr:hypothetical protein HanRHA438_Chr15g0691801 [Helianthus annuus]